MNNQITVLTTDQVCARYGWSATTLWRKQRTKEVGSLAFPLADFEGNPNKWLISTLEAWETENRQLKRERQAALIKHTAA
ncbi:hypothetical protein ACO1PK_00950 [Alishewanella sp. d11]|uniref:hypothetical protein n=1 Tax=Alishewanella sp. d11 TaxID=3414030 RepID=UPI003BF8012E